MLDAAQIVRQLALEPHPEGGHFRETYRHSDPAGGRGAMTAIYYLLAAGERSHWHRVDAIEIWHWYGGAPLNLSISANGQESTVHRLGPDILAGERPQIVVPPQAWQSAESMGAWTLVGCTVAPAFEFSGFELAAPEWQPGHLQPPAP